MVGQVIDDWGRGQLMTDMKKAVLEGKASKRRCLSFKHLGDSSYVESSSSGGLSRSRRGRAGRAGTETLRVRRPT